MPGAVAALRDLGVDPAGPGADRDPLRRRRVRGGRPTSAAAGAAACAVRRCTPRCAPPSSTPASTSSRRPVGRVAQDRPTCVVDGRRARYLVAADGLHSPIRRALGLDGPPARRRRYGLRRHYSVAPWTSHVEVHWADRGGLRDPGGRGPGRRRGADLRARLVRRAAAAFPALRDAARRASVRRGAGRRAAAAARRRAAVAGRVLLVGDAGGYVDALTGEGVALGRRPGPRGGRPRSRRTTRRATSAALAAGHPALPAADRVAARGDPLAPASGARWCRRPARLPAVFATARRTPLARPA